MIKEKSWNLRQLTPNKFLEHVYFGTYEDDSITATTTFTEFRNALRDEGELAELVTALGDETTASRMVCFPLKRLILFETVAALETEVQMDGDDLAPLVQEIYRGYFKNQTIKKEQYAVEKESKWTALHTMNGLEEYFDGENDEPNAEALEIYTKIKDRLISGAYKPSLSITDGNDVEIANSLTVITPEKAHLIAMALTEEIIYDRTYQKKSQNHVEKFVSAQLKEILDQQKVKYPGTEDPLKRLSIQKGEDRHTFLFLGAPACGKGTMVASLEVKARDELQVAWRDTIKIDTDNHRGIVSHPGGMGDDPTAYSALNDFESAYITRRAYEKVRTQLERGEGHHLVIDGVRPIPARFKLGTENNGQLHVSCASAPVDVSIERAWVRGQETGRYISSDYLIDCHKAVSRDLLKAIVTHCADTNTEMSLFNTDVPHGEQPIQVVSINMQTREAIIYNADALAEIYAKKNININATSKAELFASEGDMMDYSYVRELRALDVNIKFAQEGMEEKIEKLINAGSIAQGLFAKSR